MMLLCLAPVVDVKIDRSEPMPLHEQVAAEIRRAIADGEAGPGERLPPARDLAAVLDVNTNTVLRAQADVESAIAAHRGALLRTASLRDSVAAAQKVVDLVGRQYSEGAVDFTTVLLAQQLLVQQEDLLAASQGEEALTLVTLYKSLGGGWEPWQGGSVISAESAEQMSSRTRWGDLIAEEQQRNIAQAASSGTEQDRGWWRWRWWRPQW